MKKSITFITLLLLSFTFSACSNDEGQVKELVGTQSDQEDIQKEITLEESQITQEFKNRNWKTHEDEDWGFSIKYPSNFYTKTDVYGDSFPGDQCPMCGNGGRPLVISDNKEMGTEGLMPNQKVYITISTHKKKEGESLQSFTGDGGENRIRTEFRNVNDRVSIISEPRDINLNKYSSVGLYTEKNNWFYHVYAEVDDIEDEARRENYNLAKDIVLSFELRE